MIWINLKERFTRLENYKKVIGNFGEEQAVKFLLENKYEILERNFRCKFGEIDVIAKDGEYIVFIEVKTRKNTEYGIPAEAVNYYKQKKIIQVARYYLMNKKYTSGIRFDVVEIIAKIQNDKPVMQSIRVIKNAFQ